MHVHMHSIHNMIKDLSVSIFGKTVQLQLFSDLVTDTVQYAFRTLESSVVLPKKVEFSKLVWQHGEEAIVIWWTQHQSIGATMSKPSAA